MASIDRASHAADSAIAADLIPGSPAPAVSEPGDESAVMSTWECADPPTASVLCPTFNHVGFIRSTLNGILSQKTSFPFEVVVRDDGSTDGTADIVREFVERYPRIIRPVFEAKNTFSKGTSARAAMMAYVRAPIVALCDGDDHWIDPQKLQLQVDCLQSDPSISRVSTAFAVCSGGIIKTLEDVSSPDRPVPSRIPKPSTWVFRTQDVELSALNLGRHMMGDYFIKSQLDVVGRNVHLGDRVSVLVNHHIDSMFAGAAQRDRYHRTFHMINGWLWIAHYHRQKGNSNMARAQLKNAVAGWHAFLSEIDDAQPLRFTAYSAALLVKRALYRMLGIKR